MPSQSDSQGGRKSLITPFIPKLNQAEIPFSQDPITLQAYSQDQWPRTLLRLREKGPQPQASRTDLVVWPKDPHQLVQLIQWAHQADVSLYPYGAGSGVCGGTMPSKKDHRPRVVVDLKAMRKVRSLDSQSLL